MLGIATEGETFALMHIIHVLISKNGTTKFAILKMNKVLMKCKCFKQVDFSLRAAYLQHLAIICTLTNTTWKILFHR